MRCLILLLLLPLLQACVSPVVIDRQSDANLGAYHSYAFIPQQQDQPRQLDDQRAEQALTTTLASKGLQAVPAAEADVLVKHFFKREQRYDGSVVQFGMGYGWNRMAVGATTPVEGEVTEEYKLVVQLIDRQSQDVVWQATSRDRLDDEMASERRKAHINQAVTDMFEHFP